MSTTVTYQSKATTLLATFFMGEALFALDATAVLAVEKPAAIHGRGHGEGLAVVERGHGEQRGLRLHL